MTEFIVPFESKSNARIRKEAERTAQPRRCNPARIARQIALAHALQRRIRSGEFRDMAELARALGFTRARITQLMDLLLLAPDIQEEILFLQVAPGAQAVSERALRAALKATDWNEQRLAWKELSALLAPADSDA